MLDRIGVIAAITAYGAWGFFPIYWHYLVHLSAIETMSHRVIWSLLFYLLIAKILKKLDGIRYIFSDRKQLIGLAIAAIFIATNWLLYVWAVTHGHVMESSLGYFINPLISVLLGTFILKEHLKGFQKIALALASIGVAWLAYDYGRPPWIALGLAVSFAIYGYVKKILKAPAIQISIGETLILLPFAFITAIMIRQNGSDTDLALFKTSDLLTSADWLLLIGGGAITGIPLLLFGIAAQRLPLSTMGFFQYIAPTLQFLSAVLFFHEPLDSSRLIGFIFIWIGLGIFMTGSAVNSRR